MSEALATPRRSVAYERPVVSEADEKATTPSASDPEKARARLSVGPLAAVVGAQPAEDDMKVVPLGQVELHADNELPVAVAVP